MGWSGYLFRRVKARWQMLLLLFLSVSLAAGLLACGPMLADTVLDFALPYKLRSSTPLDSNLQVTTYQNDGATPWSRMSDPFPDGGPLLPIGSSQGASSFLGDSFSGPMKSLVQDTPYEQTSFLFAGAPPSVLFWEVSAQAYNKTPHSRRSIPWTMALCFNFKKTIYSPKELNLKGSLVRGLKLLLQKFSL
jgi:hypothetical protein